MPKPRFSLKLATFKPDVQYSEVGFSVASLTSGLINPLVSEVCGETLDYGKLFAYLFRRFGYPNFGWDGYKELTKYRLTTPRQDMFLQIVPCVSDSSSMQFEFYVPSTTRTVIDEHGQRFRKAWRLRALAWREQQGLPDWMPEWLKVCNEVLIAEGLTSTAYSAWADTLCWTSIFVMEQDKPYSDLALKADTFTKALYADYRIIEPEPAYVKRALLWQDWDEDDPFKVYAEAASIALKDLYRPVRVRDSAINAFGRVDRTTRVLKEARGAGYPSGALGNTAPSEFAELHGLIMRLGQGNAKRGLARVKRELSLFF